MSLDAEKAVLKGLLDALDARDAALLAHAEGLPSDGRLCSLFAQYELPPVEVALCLAAVKLRLDGQRTSSGAELSAMVSLSSAGRLEALSALREDGRLIAHGFLAPELLPTDPGEALDTRFRVSHHVFRLICEIFGQPAPERPANAGGPYATNAELLGDLRRLSLHYRRRAARLFHLDPWTSTGLDVTEGGAALSERARHEGLRVGERIAATRDVSRIPLLEMARDESLDLDALVMLATVLFQEHLEGVGAVDAVDLVKLISESEGELMRRRSALRPLALKGLLRLEGAYAGKDLTADASLPNEVVARMLGDAATIDSDEQLDFHAYLERLDSSDAFFSDLDDGDFGPF